MTTMLSPKIKQQIGRCALLFVAGTALHFLVGDVDVSLLGYPWVLVIAINYLYFLILFYTKSDSVKFFRSLYDRPAMITSLASMLVLTLLFGLIRQDGSTEGLWGMLGFTRMASSWIFVLFLLYFMTVIGLKAIEDIHRWKQRKLPAVVMHVSFFALLASAVFGSGEKVRVHVTALQGRSVNVGVTKEGKQVELPFVLKLNRFSLDEYAPRIYVYDGKNLSKEYVVMEDAQSQGRLGAWRVESLEYLEMAGRVSEDSGYKAMNHVGATTAIYIKVYGEGGDVVKEGWVSCGSFLFPGSTLSLPDGSELVMPRREIKKYLSEIEVWEGEGKQVFDIAVNHPATVGPWKIYQSGYDSDRGRWSATSVLECVKDSCYPVTHIAMWMILVGCVMMFVVGPKGKKEDKR